MEPVVFVYVPASRRCCVGSVGSGVKEVVLTGRRGGLEGVVGHRGHVLALAVSSDSKFLVSERQCINRNRS